MPLARLVDAVDDLFRTILVLSIDGVRPECSLGKMARKLCAAVKKMTEQHVSQEVSANRVTSTNCEDTFCHDGKLPIRRRT
jgi:hypothetical protein